MFDAVHRSIYLHSVYSRPNRRTDEEHPSLLHTMDLAVPRPPPERLPLEPEQDSEQAPQRGKRHIYHDGYDVSALESPRCDELAEAITPHVLIDRDRDKDAASHWLVTVNSVGRRDGRESRNLDSCASKPDYHDNLFVVSGMSSHRGM